MNTKDLDSILGSEKPISPTPGFAYSVMRAVHEEAYAPPPIRFPWWYLVAGAVALAVFFGLTVVASLLGAPGVASEVVSAIRLAQTLLVSSGLLWIVVGGLVSYLSVHLTLRAIP